MFMRTMRKTLPPSTADNLENPSIPTYDSVLVGVVMMALQRLERNRNLEDLCYP